MTDELPHGPLRARRYTRRVLEIGTHAVCPADLVKGLTWCGAPGEGPRALPAGQAVVLLPPGGWVDVLSVRAGADPRRRMTEQELRAWGFDVVHSANDLEHLAAAGARVLWIHHDVLSEVDPVWLRARHAECRAIGVLDGTVGDLEDRFGLGANSRGWIQSGGTRPVFALVRVFPCPTSTGVSCLRSSQSKSSDAGEDLVGRLDQPGALDCLLSRRVRARGGGAIVVRGVSRPEGPLLVELRNIGVT